MDGPDETDIAGATSRTYTPAPEDEGRKVRVRVSFTDGAGHSETLASDAYPAAGTIAAAPTGTASVLVGSAWLARFGRTVADQMLDAVEGRMSVPRSRGTKFTFAGQWVDGGGAAFEALEAREAEARLDAFSGRLRGVADEDDGQSTGTRALSAHDLLTGSSFALTGGSAQGGFGLLWGSGAVSRFDGREGALRPAGSCCSTS